LIETEVAMQKEQMTIKYAQEHEERMKIIEEIIKEKKYDR